MKSRRSKKLLDAVLAKSVIDGQKSKCGLLWPDTTVTRFGQTVCLANGSVDHKRLT
jgi:hypothetical protein